MSNLIYKKVCSSAPTFITLFIIISCSFIPAEANAGFFSFMGDLGGEQVSAKNIDSNRNSNSQNMLLLEAAQNTDPNPHKSYDNAPLAYGNALFAEIGPQGTVSDIESRVSGEISIYTVREGDTISRIAEMFGVSVNTIVWANELGKNPSIKEGQVLVILPVSGVKYTIKKGDTIRSLAFRYKVSIDDILMDNNLTLSSVLNPGDTIIIPNVEPIYTPAPKIATKAKPLAKTHINPPHHTDGPFYPGYFIRPITGGIKTQDLHGHNAIDLAAPVGTIIRASASGKVISSISNGGYNGGYGNYVIISHPNGTQTLYAHNLKNFVKIGDKVEQGQMIAKIGMTGETTGPHVHFEIRNAKMPSNF